jgi:hypothetical protein
MTPAFAEVVAEAINTLTLALTTFARLDADIAADLLRTASNRICLAQDIALREAGLTRGRR